MILHHGLRLTANDVAIFHGHFSAQSYGNPKGGYIAILAATLPPSLYMAVNPIL